MPAVRRRDDVYGGRRPKSLEGGNRGEFARAVGSGYGDLMRGVELPGGFEREGWVNERREGDFGWCGGALWR
jgi:hypothetical protein